MQRSERFDLAEHGRPATEPAPSQERDTERIRKAIEGLKEFQRTHRLRGLPVRLLVEEGRRF